MTEDTRKLCLNCAWRANCTKRFAMEDSTALHCPDYTEDIALRKSEKGKESPGKEEIN